MPGIPAWPFLVANHERLRVDYRPLVAPDFMCEQQRSATLTLLPHPQTASESFLASMILSKVGGSTFQVLALFQVWERLDPSFSDRRIQVITGLIVPGTTAKNKITEEHVKSAKLLYEPTYSAFCQSLEPSTFPVIASWPLDLTPQTGYPPTYLPSCDATRVTTQSFEIQPALRPSSGVHPMTSRALLREIRTDTLLSRTLRFFRVR